MLSESSLVHEMSDKEIQPKENINNSDGDANVSTTDNGSTEDSNNNKCAHTKRKLPSWMMSEDGDIGTSKRTKETTSIQTSAIGTANEGALRKGPETVNGPNNTATDASCKITTSVQIKLEPDDSVDNQPSTSSTNQLRSARSKTEDTVTVKAEPGDTPFSSSSPVKLNITDIKPVVKVEKADATSTTATRSSCRYGIRCYRRNPLHRVEEAHPGDSDYQRPKYPAPPKGTPDCPYGNACYRRNPVHFQQYSHPADTDFEQNYRNYRMRLRERRQQLHNSNVDDDAGELSSDLDDYDLDDPFIDDGDSEYLPSNEEGDDEEDELDNVNNDNDDDNDDEMDRAEE